MMDKENEMFEVQLLLDNAKQVPKVMHIVMCYFWVVGCHRIRHLHCVAWDRGSKRVQLAKQSPDIATIKSHIATCQKKLLKLLNPCFVVIAQAVKRP